MNNTELQSLLDEAKPAIIESLKSELTKSISWDAKQRVINEVNTHITEWVKTEIVPELANELVTQKEGILAIGKALGPKIAETMVEAVSAHFAEMMKENYKRNQFFQAVFGRGY